MSDKLVSLSGAPIFQHEERTTPFEHSGGDAALIDAVDAHLVAHVGPVAMVFHEFVSDLVHLDIHHIAPSPRLPYHVLVTSGMSERPMSPPAGVTGHQYAELALLLPRTWPLEHSAWNDETHYWPIRAIKALARLPHAFNSWIWWGHTVQHSADGASYHASTKLNAALLGPSPLLGQEFFQLEVSAERSVCFFSPHFIYPEELAFKLKNGSEALFDRFDRAGINEVLSPARRNTCRRWWQL